MAPCFVQEPWKSFSSLMGSLRRDELPNLSIQALCCQASCPSRKDQGEGMRNTDPRIADAADRLYMHGILDEIADDAMHGRLDQRDALDDAEAIVLIVLNREPTSDG